MSKINELEINLKKNKPSISDINEIDFIKRTIDNYTHESLSDKKIKKISSWRKSQNKFFTVLILNILTFGILHIISKYYPKLYLKLYCYNCSPKYSDFFLVENIYGQCKLCQTQKKKNYINNDLINYSNEESSKAYMCLFSSWNLNINIRNSNSQNTQDHIISINNSNIISFTYNSNIYEYDEVQNIIIPVYLNLAGKTHKNIINIFQEGLTSEYLVKKIEGRYGKNEYKLNINLIHIYFQKVEIKLIIFSIIYGALEFIIGDALSTLLIVILVIIILIFRKFVLYLLLNKFNTKDFTIDGEKSNQQKVKRDYLFNKIKNDKNNKNDKTKEKKHKKKHKKSKESRNDSKNNHKSSDKKINKSNKIYRKNITDKELFNDDHKEKYFEYVEINNSKILPGDIIYLQKGDYVPCDGIILEGDCVVNEIDVNERIEYSYKAFLKYSNDIFDYKTNKNNILLHGMKIVNVLNKRNSLKYNNQNQFLTILCLNTGPNTYKANKIANCLDLLERNEKYSNMYKLISGQRLIFIICITVIFFFSVLIALILILVEKKNEGTESIPKEGLFDNKNNKEPIPNGFQSENKEDPDRLKPPNDIEEDKNKLNDSIIINFLIEFLLRAFIKSFIPIYFVISSFVILLGCYRLYKINIFCYEKMRLLFAGEINTIFLSKLNILCDDKYEIKTYHPAFQSTKLSSVSLQTYYKEELKDFGTIIFNYYNNIKGKKYNKESFIGLTNISLLNKISGKYSVWLLECLLCCNNLAKTGHILQGNFNEKEIFNTLKWELKYTEDKNKENLNESYFEQIFKNTIENSKEPFSIESENDSIKSKLLYYGMDKEVKYINDGITDIFPQNYYKMIDRKNFGYQKLISRFKFFLSKSILKKQTIRKSYTNDFLIKDNSESNNNNNIMKDLSNMKCSSYKLRIYKKFITNNSLFSSAIVYNFLLKTLRFMTKGSPEKILPHCIMGTLPDNICQTISNYRKNGYIVIVCASKKLDLYSYSELNDEDYYMKELIFCGFITLKNNLKKDSKKVIEELKKMNCEIIMNTGDNLYNSFGTGFEIGILDSTKKLYSIDFDSHNGQIYVNNIYRPSLYDFEIEEKIYEIKKKIKSSSKLIKKSKRRNISTPKDENEDNPNNKINPSKNYKKNSNKINNIKYNRIRISQNILATNSKPPFINDAAFISSDRKRVLNRSPTCRKTDNNFKFLSENKISGNLKKENKNIINKNNNNNNNLNSHFPSNPKVNMKGIKKNPNSVDYRLITKINNSKVFNIVNIDHTEKKDKKNSIENSKKNISHSGTNESEMDDNQFEKEEYITTYFSNLSYFSDLSFRNLEKNSIFCVSGKALRYLCENKENFYCSTLLRIISNKTKIFFSMTSEDKSFLIDYYRSKSDKKTCMIGYGISDLDSIMTAHVGISLKKPNNPNMILCHFYLSPHNLMNIKAIIGYGRVVLENIFLLLISCVFCTGIINMYMILSFYILLKITPSQLTLFNLIYYSLSFLGFTNSADNNININLKKNNKLFWKYIIIQIVGNIIIKGYDIVLFFFLYRKNSYIEDNKRNEIFTSYFSILSCNQIFTTIFGFNYITFYRKKILDNYIFCIALILVFYSFLIITCLSRTGFNFLILQFFYFEDLQEKSDTFDDRNKLIMFLIIIIDMVSTILFITFTQYFFNKKIDETNKKEIKED